MLLACRLTLSSSRDRPAGPVDRHARSVKHRAAVPPRPRLPLAAGPCWTAGTSCRTSAWTRWLPRQQSWRSWTRRWLRQLRRKLRQQLPSTPPKSRRWRLLASSQWASTQRCALLAGGWEGVSARQCCGMHLQSVRQCMVSLKQSSVPRFPCACLPARCQLTVAVQAAELYMVRRAAGRCCSGCRRGSSSCGSCWRTCWPPSSGSSAWRARLPRRSASQAHAAACATPGRP